MTSHCCDLTEAEEEEDLSVLTTGSFPEMVASHWVEEEEVQFGHEVVLDRGC